MKNTKKLLLPILAMLTLASCSSRGDSTGADTTAPSCPEVSQVTPVNFAQQCQLAGITLVHEDKNANLGQTQGADTSADINAGASTPSYTKGSITTFEELLYRSSLQYYIYTWVEDETGVATLAEAAALENAKYIDDVFPNDGKKYIIKEAKNAIGTKSFVTADAEGNSNVAVFGSGFAKEEVEGKTVYFCQAFYLTSGVTTTNLLNTGKGSILYYEYNPTSPDKMGVGTRNYGCRVDFTVDFTNTQTIGLDHKTYTDFTTMGNAPATSTYAALKTKLILTNLRTLG